MQQKARIVLHIVISVSDAGGRMSLIMPLVNKGNATLVGLCVWVLSTVWCSRSCQTEIDLSTRTSCWHSGTFTGWGVLSHCVHRFQTGCACLPIVLCLNGRRRGIILPTLSELLTPTISPSPVVVILAVGDQTLRLSTVQAQRHLNCKLQRSMSSGNVAKLTFFTFLLPNALMQSGLPVFFTLGRYKRHLILL